MKIYFMKKILLIAGVISLSVLSGCEQELKDSEVPSLVKSSFAKNYPGVNAKWEKEEENYEAEFKKEGKSMSATFQPDGKMLESEESIIESQLPAAATGYLKTHYEGKRIKECARITGSDGTVTYETELEGMDVIFDNSGNFLKEEKD
jgi:hypothetical protein